MLDLLRPLRRTLPSLAIGALALVAASTAWAEDDEAIRLEARGKAQRYHLATTAPASSIDTGGAAIYVRAPLDVVRRIVTDYGHYQTVIPTFSQSRLIGKKNGVAEVYLDVPVAHGAAHVWALVKMLPPEKTADGEVIRAQLVKGNVDDFRAVWRLRKVDEEHTVLKLELLVDPTLPLPASMITPELEYGADRAVSSVRKEAERRAAQGGAVEAPAAVAADATAPDEVEEAKAAGNVAKR